MQHRKTRPAVMHLWGLCLVAAAAMQMHLPASFAAQVNDTPLYDEREIARSLLPQVYVDYGSGPLQSACLVREVHPFSQTGMLRLSFTNYFARDRGYGWWIFSGIGAHDKDDEPFELVVKLNPNAMQRLASYPNIPQNPPATYAFTGADFDILSAITYAHESLQHSWLDEYGGHEIIRSVFGTNAECWRAHGYRIDHVTFKNAPYLNCQNCSFSCERPGWERARPGTRWEELYAPNNFTLTTGYAARNLHARTGHKFRKIYPVIPPHPLVDLPSRTPRLELVGGAGRFRLVAFSEAGFFHDPGGCGSLNSLCPRPWIEGHSLTFRNLTLSRFGDIPDRFGAQPSLDRPDGFYLEVFGVPGTRIKYSLTRYDNVSQHGRPLPPFVPTIGTFFKPGTSQYSHHFPFRALAWWNPENYHGWPLTDKPFEMQEPDGCRLSLSISGLPPGNHASIDFFDWYYGIPRVGHAVGNGNHSFIYLPAEQPWGPEWNLPGNLIPGVTRLRLPQAVVDSNPADRERYSRSPSDVPCVNVAGMAPACAPVPSDPVSGQPIDRHFHYHKQQRMTFRAIGAPAPVYVRYRDAGREVLLEVTPNVRSVWVDAGSWNGVLYRGPAAWAEIAEGEHVRWSTDLERLPPAPETLDWSWVFYKQGRVNFQLPGLGDYGYAVTRWSTQMSQAVEQQIYVGGSAWFDLDTTIEYSPETTGPSVPRRTTMHPTRFLMTDDPDVPQPDPSVLLISPGTNVTIAYARTEAIAHRMFDVPMPAGGSTWDRPNAVTLRPPYLITWAPGSGRSSLIYRFDFQDASAGIGTWSAVPHLALNNQRKTALAGDVIVELGSNQHAYLVDLRAGFAGDTRDIGELTGTTDSLSSVYLEPSPDRGLRLIWHYRTSISGTNWFHLWSRTIVADSEAPLTQWPIEEAQHAGSTLDPLYQLDAVSGDWGVTVNSWPSGAEFVDDQAYHYTWQTLNLPGDTWPNGDSFDEVFACNPPSNLLRRYSSYLLDHSLSSTGRFYYVKLREPEYWEWPEWWEWPNWPEWPECSSNLYINLPFVPRIYATTSLVPESGLLGLMPRLIDNDWPGLAADDGEYGTLAYIRLYHPDVTYADVVLRDLATGQEAVMGRADQSGRFSYPLFSSSTGVYTRDQPLLQLHTSNSPSLAWLDYESTFYPTGNDLVHRVDSVVFADPHGVSRIPVADPAVGRTAPPSHVTSWDPSLHFTTLQSLTMAGDWLAWRDNLGARVAVPYPKPVIQVVEEPGGGGRGAGLSEVLVRIDSGEDPSPVLTAVPLTGTPPYTFQWESGEVTQSVQHQPGPFAINRVTVTDAAGLVGDATHVSQDMSLTGFVWLRAEVETSMLHARRIQADAAWLLTDGEDGREPIAAALSPDPPTSDGIAEVAIAFAREDLDARGSRTWDLTVVNPSDPADEGRGGLAGTARLALDHKAPPQRFALSMMPAHGDENVATNDVRLEWSEVDGAVAYEVYFGTSADSLDLIHHPELNHLDLPLTLEPGTTHFWRVDSVGRYETWPGTLSRFTTVPVDAVPAAPLFPADGGSVVHDDVQLNWTSGTRISEYVVDVRTGADSVGSFTTRGTAYALPSLDPGVAYTWRVDSVTEDAAILVGDEFSFQTLISIVGSASIEMSLLTATKAQFSVVAEDDSIPVLFWDWQFGDESRPLAEDYVNPSSTGVVRHDYAQDGYYAIVVSGYADQDEDGVGELVYSGTLAIQVPFPDFVDFCAASTPCSGNGWCDGLGACRCFAGWFGPGCEESLSGSIVAWGHSGSGQGDVPVPNTDFVAVAAGDYHNLGLKADGSVMAWGRNDFGQTDVPAPNTEFVAVAAGEDNSLGLKADGSIVSWGENTWGQADVPAPNTGFVAVAAGGRHSLGLKTDGSIVAWGLNNNGQTNVPAPNTGFVAVAAGGWHSLGLKADGSIVAWGSNDFGQTDVPAPNTEFVAVAAGPWYSLGLKADGSIVAWGSNDFGQTVVPAPNADFVAVAVGYIHGLGLKTDGSIVAWGYNGWGQTNVPEHNEDFAAVAGGLYHSLAIRAAEQTAGACCTSQGCSEVADAAACVPFICNVTTNELPACGGPCGTLCWGDADGNGFVNAGDRGFISAAIGLTDPALVCQYDMDGNGVVNAADRGFVSAGIGACVPLPDYQNGSGLNGGAPDTRFGSATFMGDGSSCAEVTCP
jgi:hypothetical protein